MTLRASHITNNAQAKKNGRGRLELRMAPLAGAIALALVAAPAFAGPPALGSGWFAAKRDVQGIASRTGRLPNGSLAGIDTAAKQQQKARQQLQRSVANLNRTAISIAQAHAAQEAARAAAQQAASNVRDGLGDGGLKVDEGATAIWQNADAPDQSVANGKTQVTIKQTADKAILDWETFNVGRNTTVDFQQRDADWAVLNRVNDPQGRPSQILGKIQADGTVMVVNRNGIVFTGSSQVNVRNLVAAAVDMSNEQFNKGLYSETVGSGSNQRYTPSFGNNLAGTGAGATFDSAEGDVIVEAGAQIETTTPKSVTQGGGYALLLGREVTNSGAISTPQGQTVLAAGDSFIIRKGMGSEANLTSTVRGNEVSTRRNAGSESGTVTNDGIILSRTGDITLTGHSVNQRGVALASTSVNTRGTIHLLNSATDVDGSITLSADSRTAILVDDTDQTALDAQRDALAADTGPNTDLHTGSGRDFDNLGRMDDRPDQSRIEIVSGGTVEFEGNSLTLATGGQVAVSAGRRTLVGDGAEIDVAGAIGVKVAMESNNVQINVQGNEQRDAPVNRDSTNLNNLDIWVDRRTLVFVPKGTNGYESDRWYTAGGLLEVSGYLANSGHSAGEWMAQGGTVTLAGNEVVTQSGSSINLSGGTLDVQDGYINQTWLRGANGRLYEVSKAPGDLLYDGLYRGFEDTHARWGEEATRFFYNPILAPRRRFEAGYTVGRDAGRLIVATNSAVLEGDIVGEVFQGVRQTRPGEGGLDGYLQLQTAAARRAHLVIGQYLPVYDEEAGALVYNLENTLQRVILGAGQDPIADGLSLDGVLPPEREGSLYLNVDQLNSFELGALTVAAGEEIVVDGALAVASGGDIELYGPHVEVTGDLTARGGSIALGNVIPRFSRTTGWQDGVMLPTVGDGASVLINAGSTLDTRGLWTNLQQDLNGSSLPYLDGGSVSLQSTGSVVLAAGSAIDVSSGAAIRTSGERVGGRGGNVTLTANSLLAPSTASPESLILDGELRGFGVNGGGTLRLSADQIVVTDGGAIPEPGKLVIGGDFFTKGFSHYELTGYDGLTVTDDTAIDVTIPVYRFAADSSNVLTGAHASDALEVWLPPIYQEDPVQRLLTQRPGASLSMNAGDAGTGTGGELTIGKGAIVNVDPGQRIELSSFGLLTIDGTLRAPGGEIVVHPATVPLPEGNAQSGGQPNSVWVGEHAALDVSGRAVTAKDALGRIYGTQYDGGRINLAGEFLVIRQGAILDASGTQMTVDVPQGNGAVLRDDSVVVASAGGEIALSAAAGLYLDGTLRAAKGGDGAAAGALNLTLETPLYGAGTPDEMVRPRELLIVADTGNAPSLTDPGSGLDELVYGYGRIGLDQIQAGGFGDLSLYARDLITFDGDIELAVSQSIRLYQGVIGNTTADANVRIAAPYVLLSGRTEHNARLAQPVDASLNSWSFSTQEAASRLLVEANQIDVKNAVRFGIESQIRLNGGVSETVDRRGYSLVQMNSTGDLRFLGTEDLVGGSVIAISGYPGSVTALVTASDMTLSAARIYPATGATAVVIAGRQPNPPGENAPVLRIERAPGSGSAETPFSIFGRLDLLAPVIEQAGAVYAPLGSIALGTSGGDQQVRLAQGSLTSVSAAGLVLPYGGTIDDLKYLYNGTEIRPTDVGGTSVNGPNQGISLRGASLVVERGAVLDLSGGGELTGAAFISGRGGSTDPLLNALIQYDPENGQFKLPSAADHPIYAIVPGYNGAYAPTAPVDQAEGYGGSLPKPGQQITINQGVPGLPAGTYTLLPSYYALLPGAFRVEVGAGQPYAGAINNLMRNGSWSVASTYGIANTDVRGALSQQVILTAGDVLRRYGQYNETSYRDFLVAQAEKLGTPRPMLPEDAKVLEFRFTPNANNDQTTLKFDGVARFDRADGGFGGQLIVVAGGSNQAMEIVEKSATPDFAGISLRADELNAVGADRISIGGWTYDIDSGRLAVKSQVGDLSVRSGAVLSAPEVMLITASANDIVVEQGASINTIGQGSAPYDSSSGYQYDPAGQTNVLIVSNGWVDFPTGTGAGSGSIDIGGCDSSICTGETTLYSEGTIVSATNNLSLSDAVRFGTRNLTLAVSGLNIGSDAALVDAATRGVLPAGMQLSQALLTRLLNGNPEVGTPALERLIFSAKDSVNFYGTTDLSTLDPVTGESSLDQLVFNTPAIFGYGSESDRAVLSTGTLVWNGVAGSQSGAAVTDGPGTGTGILDVHAQQIVFGYADDVTPTAHQAMQRLALGFSTVNLNATDRITANGEGTLSVYRAQGDYLDGEYAYTGGTLNLITPLLTGEAGSINHIVAGNALNLSAPLGGTVGTNDALGATLSLTANTVTLDSAIALASGKLTVHATDDIRLNDSAQIDLAGRTIEIFDETRYSWGGDVFLESDSGDILQSAGSTIDISAQNNQAGTLTATALGDGAGRISLVGQILGHASGNYNAGGTVVPFDGGGIIVAAQTIDDFADLNRRLTEGGVVGRRSFRIKQGDLLIGDEIKARQVDVSVDGGSLRVVGKIDASGVQVGAIRLAARDGMTLDSGAVLDAHGTGLRIDSDGQIIDAPNRAIVELRATAGRLVLNDGVMIDLRAGTDVPVGTGIGENDGRARGTLDLDARRVGGSQGSDVDIETIGQIEIEGAKTVAVNGFWRYDDAPIGTDPSASGKPYQVIDQAYLDAAHLDSEMFIENAGANADLASRLSGLGSYVLRPGVEIVGDGDLVVQGDLDLSGYRYGSTVDPGIRGSGEPGVLVIRAGGDLSIFGSINDGFAPPPDTPDDGRAWRLIGDVGMDDANGVELWKSDLILPRSITILSGTSFPVTDGVVLNFDLPVQGATLKANVRMPMEFTLAQVVTLQAGTALGADVFTADGTHYAKGTVLADDLTLTAGARLGAGMSLSQAVSVAPFTLPKGIQLGIFSGSLVLSTDKPLPMGAFLPSGTKLVLDSNVPLRDLDANGKQGRMWAVASMLARGVQSWDVHLSAGSDLQSADGRALQTPSILGNSGNLILSDPHYMQDLSFGLYGESPIFSVIRTGTGDLDLLAGGDYQQPSLYGIYTAGTPSSPILDTDGNPVMDAYGHDAYNLPRGIDENTFSGAVLGFSGWEYEPLVTGENYAAWYPEQGGNVFVSTQGDMKAAVRAASNKISGFSPRPSIYSPSNYVGNWLWRQGGDVVDQPAAWWVNFGTYVPTSWYSIVFAEGYSVEGFTGIGALGGGNVAVQVDGNAGAIVQTPSNGTALYSQALTLAIGSTGRMTPGGELIKTGGGDLAVKIGGALNPGISAARATTGVLTSVPNDLNGAFTNMRGAIDVQAGSIGRIDPIYGLADNQDPRGSDALRPSLARQAGGPVIVAGDTTVRLSALGDLVLGGVGDPGRTDMLNPVPFGYEGSWFAGGGNSWYSLWTENTGIELFSAGGNLTPMTGQHFSLGGVGENGVQGGANTFLYPSRLSAIAPHGSIYYSRNPQLSDVGNTLTLAPSEQGILDFMAGDSIYGGGFRINVSGANLARMLTPDNPGFLGTQDFGLTTVGGGFPNRLFPDGDESATGSLNRDSHAPIRFYALQGDLLGIRNGRWQSSSAGNNYQAAKPVWMRAGRDIVNTEGLFLNNNPTDISLISAGRDILYANVEIVGPGGLDVTAGRNLLQEDQGRLASLGLIGGSGDPTGGASISVTVGTGSRPVDYAGFVQQYVDPENLAVSGEPLADQPGKVVKTYEEELVQWLTDRFGFEGSTEEAQAYFAELPIEQQAVFGRQVYFAELTAGGREYTDVDGPRTGSYLRGRNAIAALLPTEDAEGNPIDYAGDLTMFGPSGIQTLAGGDIQILAPGGALTFGTEGVSPPSTAGVITQGSGNVQMYALGNILLGQSRVMTTFGGDVVAWSAEGNINAGRGSKTSVVYTPLRRQYDNVGNITMSPNVPATGAGFSTQAPIPEVPPGFMDLIAPEGTVDAGEAGISASGSVNIAALQVVNAANIKAQGEVTGVPLVAAVNVGALTSASAAASSATQAAQTMVRQQQATARQNMPSIISVQIVGFGSEPLPAGQ